MLGKSPEMIGQPPNVPAPSSSSTLSPGSRSNDRSGLISNRHEDLCARARWMGNLAEILFEHYHCWGPTELLDAAAELYQAQQQLAAITNASTLPLVMARLGDVFLAQHELSNHSDALDRSIRHYIKAQSYHTLTSHNSIENQVALAYALFSRFELTGCEDDCRSAVNLLDEARNYSETNPTSALHIWVLSVACLVKCTRACVSLEPFDIEVGRSILRVLKEASTLLLPRSRYLRSLIAQARLCWLIILKTGQSELVDYGLQAIILGQANSSEEAIVVHHMLLVQLFEIHMMIHRFHWDTSRVHLDTQVDIGRQTRSAPLSSRNNLAHYYSLHLWARAVLARAIECDTSHFDELEQAVDSLKEAFLGCPQSHILRPHMLNHIIYALSIHFNHSGRVSVLDDLIALHGYASEYLDTEVGLAVNLAEAMISRSRIADRSRAKNLLYQAAILCQNRKASANFAQLLKEEESEVAMMLITASRLLAQMNLAPFLDSESTLQLARQDLNIHYDPSTRISFVLEQIHVLMLQARQHQNADFLSEAAHVIERELGMDYIGTSIYRADLLAAKADILVTSSDLSHKSECLPEAWDLYHQAATLESSGRPTERFQACLRWATHAATRGLLEESYKAYCDAIDLLPRLVLLGDDVIGRIEALRQVDGLATSAFATALMLGDVPAAIQCLERTRGIMWLQSFPTKGGPRLNLLPRSLQDEFTSARDRLTRAHNATWTTRRHAAESMIKVLDQIRALPGFERFLLPPVFEEITSALQKVNGFVIIIAPCQTHCDVLVLGDAEGNSHIKLPEVHAEMVKRCIGRFGRLGARVNFDAAVGDTSRGFRKMDPDWLTGEDDAVLSELWTSVIRPIFDSMGLLKTRKSQLLPRVWWCPIGSMVSLPLHAAGTYHKQSQEYVGAYAVSSYAPTLTALHRILTEMPDEVAQSRYPAKMLLLAQPETGENPSIPNALIEAEAIKDLVPAGSLLNDQAVPNNLVDSVLASVPDANILHLACHGHQDRQNPLNSGFDLENGRLTLGGLMQVSTPNAQLAYLSACESASSDESRPDEGLNLAGAMIFVGFKSVVATLWAMNDIDGPFMAERIYKRIFRDGRLDMAAVPYALNDAVGELRELGVPASRWATYVHFGV